MKNYWKAYRGATQAFYAMMMQPNSVSNCMVEALYELAFWHDKREAYTGGSIVLSSDLDEADMVEWQRHE